MDMRRDLDRKLEHRQPRSVDAHRDGFERPADPVAACHTCGRDLLDGDTATAADWVVLDGDRPRREVRYECEACGGGDDA